MARKNWLVATGLVVLLIGCGEDKGASKTNVTPQKQQQVTTEMKTKFGEGMQKGMEGMPQQGMMEQMKQQQPTGSTMPKPPGAPGAAGAKQ